MTRIRLVVVDDHALFRAGLVSQLGSMPEFQVVGEAGNVQEALGMVQRMQPDIVLLDENTPMMNGVETVSSLLQQENKCRILLLTSIIKPEDKLFGAIHADVDGFLWKNAEPDELRKAILQVYEGKSGTSAKAPQPVLHIVAGSQSTTTDGGLSKRELEVLGCLAHGKTTLQIASELFVSENTVKTHVRHILGKLEASNRAEAVSKAVQMGLIHRM